MDRFIKRFDRVVDEDLSICAKHGVAYQRDMKKSPIDYGREYLDTYNSFDYAESKVAKAVKAGRSLLLTKHFSPALGAVLDVGACSGAFMRAASEAGFRMRGFDVIPEAASRMMERDEFSSSPEGFKAITMWDSIEHMSDPGLWLDRIERGALLFISVPIMRSIEAVRSSKHYKPGEHLYYWTEQGFVDWMAAREYRLIEISDQEVRAGRESIGAFVFKRDLPEARDFIAQYSELHSSKFYGSSAVELHLATVAKVVRELKPTSILDFGCGRSDLVAHFWRDGERRIERYDPAIPKYKLLPEGEFDMVFAGDIMEHVPLGAVDKVLQQIRSKSSCAVFSISTKLARAKLPDGSNAHCTLLSRKEWARWIADYFGSVDVLPVSTEHELVMVAGKMREDRSSEKSCPTCGGEMYRDSFRHPRREEEHFFRCRACGFIEEIETAK